MDRNFRVQGEKIEFIFSDVKEQLYPMEPSLKWITWLGT